MVIIFFCTGVFCRLSKHYIIILSSRLEDAQKANNLSQRVRAHSCCILFPSPPFPLRFRSKCHNQYVLHLDSYTPPLFINKIIRKKQKRNNFQLQNFCDSLIFPVFFFCPEGRPKKGISIHRLHHRQKKKKKKYKYI